MAEKRNWAGIILFVVIIILLLAVSIPGLVRARISANEGYAVGVLRTLSTSQAQFQAAAMIDQDNDGTGEYGLLNELSGMSPVRYIKANRGKKVLSPFLSSKFRTNDKGYTIIAGYCFKVYLPHAKKTVSDIAPEKFLLASENLESINAQEQSFVGYGWPLHFRSTGIRCFVTDQSGEVPAAPNQLTQYQGDKMPSYNAAISTDDESTTLNFGNIRGGMQGKDGQTWTAAGNGHHGDDSYSPNAQNSYAPKRTSGSPQVWRRQKQYTHVAKIRIKDSKTYLEPTSVRIMVKIEGLRAQTIVDYSFYNPTWQTTEGQFQCVLPDNSSISYFAFYQGREGHGDISLPPINLEALHTLPVSKMIAQEKSNFGPPQPAYVVEKRQALVAYETMSTLPKVVDPALVEWAGNNTFSIRVFPLWPKRNQRIVLAYEQTLPKWQNNCRYEFNLPKKSENIEFLLSSHMSYDAGGKINVPITSSVKNGHYVYHFNDKEISKKHIVYEFPTAKSEAIIGKDVRGQNYLYTRFRIKLPQVLKKQSNSQAIFLLDTSASQGPDEFAICVKLLDAILKNNPQIEKFNILLFNVETLWWDNQGWIENNKKQRQKLLQTLNNVILEGATDISAVLWKLLKTPWVNQPGKIDVFLLSNAQITWGSSNFIPQFRKNLKFTPYFYCYDFGLGSANRLLFEKLQQMAGGHTFLCYGPSQVEKASIAHNIENFEVKKIDTSGLEDIIITDVSLFYPNQEIPLTGKIVKDSKVVLNGIFLGKPHKLIFSFKNIAAGSLAPRAFGEIAVKKLENLRNPTLREGIIAYSRYFNVPGRTCSLLMLESKRDYQRFSVDLSSQTKIPKFKNLLRKIPGHHSYKQDFLQYWQKLKKNPLSRLKDTSYSLELLKLLHKEEFFVAPQLLSKSKNLRSDFDKNYLSKLKQQDDNPETYIKESKKRFKQKQFAEAIRCLSTVVEQQPYNSKYLRMVSSLLMKHRYPAHALRLLQRVQDKRPLEPQSYWNLAQCYIDMKKYGMANFYYEILLGNDFNERFSRQFPVIKNRYIGIIQKQLIAKTPSKLHPFLRERLKTIVPGYQIEKFADITIALTWDTANTDIDLFVREPTGNLCFYNHPKSKLGGKMSEDIRAGYGAEIYQTSKAKAGIYKIYLQYYKPDPSAPDDQILAEVFVRKKDQQGKTFYSPLKKKGDYVYLASISWP